jgi:hypothetical protein
VIDVDRALRSRTKSFAEDLDLVLREVLPAAVPAFVVGHQVTDDGSLVVRQQPAAGIPLRVDGTTVLRLEAR